MDGHGFISDMIKAMERDKNLVPEILMPQLAKILFSGRPTKMVELTEKLISFREKYGIDYITVLPTPGKPAIVRFWKIKEISKLPEEINEHDDN